MARKEEFKELSDLYINNNKYNQTYLNKQHFRDLYMAKNEGMNSSENCGTFIAIN